MRDLSRDKSLLAINSATVKPWTLEQLVEGCARSGITGIAPWRDYVIGGGLMSYGPNYNEMFKTAGNTTARVLKGEKAGAIAVAQPALELVVSQRNAKNLGVTLPAALVAKAKEVLT